MGNRLAAESQAPTSASTPTRRSTGNHGAKPPSRRRARNTSRSSCRSAYLACFWCHVMAEEAYSDPRVIKALKEDFVAIKVDREERP